MKHALIKTTLLSGLLVLGTSAFAQDRDRDRDRYDRDSRSPDWSQQEQRYHENGRDDSWWRGRMFQRVREDLDHVQAVTFPFSADQYRVSRTKQELNELQGKLEAGRYDQPELDRTIQGLERVLSNNNLSARDRDMLQDDLRRLRDFRANHDAYGARTGA